MRNMEIEKKEYKSISDLNLKVSVPFNNDPDLIEQVLPLKSYIDSLYLPLHFNVFPFPSSGERSRQGRTNWEGFNNEKKYNELLLYVILKLKRNNIKIRVILNSIIFDFQDILERWYDSK